jgi:predicted enzyme related to lactoylglutathione lyase
VTGPRTYPHGVTSWIDTEQDDPGAAARFYGGLFGWRFDDDGVASLDGVEVAAIAPGRGHGPAWNTYVAVDDADATVAAVTAGGGAILSPPADAGPAGRTAICADPAGASFRLWQAGRRRGAQLTNTPGTWNFSDLHTPDGDAAMAFYVPIFGWRTVALDPGGGVMIQVPGYGDHLASTVDPGIHERQAGAPPGFADVIGGLVAGEPAHWHVTFTVADRDGSAASAERLGATVVSSASDLWTRNALIRDPQGAEFTVSQFTPPDGF